MIATERQRFLDDYLRIRRAEGRGSDDPEYYRALPYRDLSGKLEAQWRMRAKTYRYFEKHLLGDTRLDVIDLGAGCGWLSYRLSIGGHRPVAVDILTDERDGLGAARHYPQFPKFEAEFDRLPFADGAFDLAVYNASLHYSSNYLKTLAETRRCVRRGGRIMILDSPVYRQKEHGERMRRERHEQFLKQYGTESDHVASVEYLDLATIGELAKELGIEWRIHKPWYGMAWHTRGIRAKLRGSRPPSKFWILEGKLI
ncbi:MAG TPA: class I SAM-dependent methyltransferase [Bryobacteraceae bacterium]|nr:class I SAM-dependent methyltransferase [Bryobacteraceae bacterium]